MDHLEVQPHIQLRKGQVHPVVLTVGDPFRVDLVAKFCDSHEELAFSREYRSMNVESKGQKFTVISHGIGSSGAMICFEELIKLGAKVIIRAGTCGSLVPDRIKTGDVFIPYAVGRDTDVTDLYVPKGMPAVASPRIYQALVASGKNQGISVFTGIGLSNSIFYAHDEDHLHHLKKWAKLADIVEFEFQSLFLVGAARGIETGGISTVDGSPLEWDQANFDPKGEKCATGKENMMHICIETCARLSKEFDSA